MQWWVPMLHAVQCSCRVQCSCSAVPVQCSAVLCHPTLTGHCARALQVQERALILCGTHLHCMLTECCVHGKGTCTLPQLDWRLHCTALGTGTACTVWKHAQGAGHGGGGSWHWTVAQGGAWPTVALAWTALAWCEWHGLAQAVRGMHLKAGL